MSCLHDMCKILASIKQLWSYVACLMKRNCFTIYIWSSLWQNKVSREVLCRKFKSCFLIIYRCVSMLLWASYHMFDKLSMNEKSLACLLWHRFTMIYTPNILLYYLTLFFLIVGTRWGSGYKQDEGNANGRNARIGFIFIFQHNVW